jgi:hypothetical protein
VCSVLDTTPLSKSCQCVTLTSSRFTSGAQDFNPESTSTHQPTPSGGRGGANTRVAGDSMQRAMKRRADQDECSGSTSSSVKPISTHLPRPTPVTKDGVRMWEVEEVLDEDTEKGHVHVKWLGY